MVPDKRNYRWCVIGAGPAGIFALGRLIDLGCPPHRIAWIDPMFHVGDLGGKWYNVDSNTKAGTLYNSLLACDSFGFKSVADQFNLNNLDPEATCKLKDVVDPLQWITKRLQEQVASYTASARDLVMSGHQWQISLDNGESLNSDQVILAIGAETKQLDEPSLQTVPLTTALDYDQLKQHMQPGDRFAVFGSSHSAIMAVKHLINLGAEQVVNFYRSPLKYAVFFDQWILHDNTGLKGKTAQWARDYLHTELPSQLVRCYNDDTNRAQYMPQCNKAIYGVGFETRQTLTVQGLGALEHNPHTGIIAPGLFGLGIAFPSFSYDPAGNGEYQVGIGKFANFLNKALPLWVNYSP